MTDLIIDHSAMESGWIGEPPDLDLSSHQPTRLDACPCPEMIVDHARVESGSVGTFWHRDDRGVPSNPAQNWMGLNLRDEK